MIKNVAKALSYVFHPLLIPTLGFLLLMNSSFYFTLISFEAKKFILLIVLMSTLVLPLISIGLMMLTTRFKLNLDKASDRIIPMLNTAIFYYLGFYFLGKLPIFPIYKLMLISSVLTIAILLLITIRWKISAHMAAIGGLIGIFLALSLRLNFNGSLLLSVLLLVAGLVGTSRILLQKHSPQQVYAGFVIGLLVNSLVILLV
ncbi:phosphatase PAP2 family protein [Mangrovibacterium marinum]|uniref:PAP2 superfamily protein n=1 Tax=Mangrovibacterium marinum TaxID=1639118 RepID=A0A2T5C6W4_9BACT|nr:phosphatase PAP2 family protein [Mangrovibacterium marinum]PTN10681.1 PAP2 superfamily protein [Mangrovibacterium marinum]